MPKQVKLLYASVTPCDCPSLTRWFDVKKTISCLGRSVGQIASVRSPVRHITPQCARAGEKSPPARLYTHCVIGGIAARDDFLFDRISSSPT